VCDRLVVVGPERPTNVAGVSFVQDAEPGGGPVPAVAAGLSAVPEADVVLVLAVDLPLLGTADLRHLLGAIGRAGAAAAEDEGGPNPLLAAYTAPALRACAGALGAGARAAALLPPDVVTVDLGRATLNVNEPADLAEADSATAPGDPK
jgi:molybdopterin-guanine dinucleotide biosynthesis protein A